jgi:hypothetical protein
MMAELDFAGALATATIGIVSGFTGAVLKGALDRRTKLDDELMRERRSAYQVLWAKTQVLPKWPRATSVSRSRLHAFSEELRDWYFVTGGMYLSETSRARYGDVQEAIEAVISAAGSDAVPIADSDYDRIQQACSALRTELTRDLLSRRQTSAWI